MNGALARSPPAANIHQVLPAAAGSYRRPVEVQGAEEG